MNEERKQRVQMLLDILNSARDGIAKVHEEELNAIENSPDNQQSTEQTDQMKEFWRDFNKAENYLLAAIKKLEEAMEE